MRDLITSGVKTAVQIGVAAAISWLASIGIEVAGDAAVALQTAVFAVATGAVAAILNALGKRFPIVNKIVSLGLSETSATY